MAGEWPLQQVGSKGEDVRTVQHLLAVHGHPVAVDAQFGPMTKGAVQTFQTAAGLGADGIVGDQTWAALVVAVSAGDNGDAVLALQGQLRSQGWRLAQDGAFGPQTDRSVRDFQVARHLTADGIAGPLTWRSLVAGFRRLATADQASAHLYDAWGASDRAVATTNATLAAVDLVLRGQRGELTNQGCTEDELLGPGHLVCSYTYEGGAVNFHVQGTALDGYYVESAQFIAD